MKFIFLSKSGCLFPWFPIYGKFTCQAISQKNNWKIQISHMGRRIIFVKLGNSVSVNNSLNTNKRCLCKFRQLRRHGYIRYVVAACCAPLFTRLKFNYFFSLFLLIFCLCYTCRQLNRSGYRIGSEKNSTDIMKTLSTEVFLLSASSL